MARVQIVADGIELDSPTLVEGLPGAGLVGKIAADHLVETFDMTYYGGVHCEGLPEVAVYRADGSDLYPPVRLYADEERDLLVLQADIPVSPSGTPEFATCITGWLAEHGATPVYLSGLPVGKDGVPALYGVATGDGDRLLEEAGIVPPREGGLVSGPTGALLSVAGQRDLDAVGLIVETEGQFPDPEAARVIITEGVEPLTGLDIDTGALVEHAEEIQEARERLAERLEDAGDESTEAQPLRMFQ